VYGYGLLRPEFEAFREKYRRVQGASLQDMVRDLATAADA
jgi:hypothetical protein